MVNHTACIILYSLGAKRMCSVLFVSGLLQFTLWLSIRYLQDAAVCVVSCYIVSGWLTRGKGNIGETPPRRSMPNHILIRLLIESQEKGQD